MNIKVPISSLEELKKLVHSGINEIYCGVLSEEWLNAYSNIASINRVERSKGNLKNYEELSHVVELAHEYQIKVHLTLNALYTQEQRSDLNREIESILKTDVDGLILSDLGLILLLKKIKIQKEIHASTGCTAFNSENIDFLKSLGISRIVLPRSLRLDELIHLLSHNPDVDFEVFIMNGRCRNIDGFCTFHHGLSDLTQSGLSRLLVYSGISNALQERLVKSPFIVKRSIMKLLGTQLCSAACAIDYQVSGGEELGNVPSLDFLDNIFSCGVCFLYHFYHNGVKSVKIVGRSFPVERKIKDVTYIRTCIDELKKGKLSEKQFKEYAQKLYRDIYNKPCNNNCYYYDKN